MGVDIDPIELLADFIDQSVRVSESGTSSKRFEIPLFRWKPQFLETGVLEISRKNNVSEWTWIDLFGNGAKMEFEIAILEHVRTTERTV